MNVRALQQQLAASEHLLPSQRDLLSRLLFQLAFNDFSSLGIIGAEGSGKTTLAVALAELFSASREQQINIAMLQAPINDEQLLAKLSQQWFSAKQLDFHQLNSNIVAAAEESEFVLIADNAHLLSKSQYDLVLALPIKLFMFSCQPDSNLQLNLTIPVLSLADCQQLLQAEQLDPLALAERFANCHNNIHLLLANKTVDGPIKTTRGHSGKLLFPLMTLSALAVVALITFWQAPKGVDVTLPDSVEQTIDLPVSTIPAAEVTSEVVLKDALQDESDLEAPQEIERTAAEVVAEKPPASAPEAVTLAEHHLVKLEAVQEDIVPVTETVKPPVVVNKSAAAKTALPPADDYDHVNLLNMPPRQFLVQLAVLSGDNALARFRTTYPSLPVMTYARENQGKAHIVIVSGPFATNNAARQHIQQLPASLSSSGPFIKTVAAVQQEIKAWQHAKLAETSQEN